MKQVSFITKLFLMCFISRGRTEIRDSKIYVHLIPHSHDDVGWLKTVDQYYYGTNQSICKNNVQYILNTVLESLMKDSKRKFIFSEMSFFSVSQIQDTNHSIVNNFSSRNGTMN